MADEQTLGELIADNESVPEEVRARIRKFNAGQPVLELAKEFSRALLAAEDVSETSMRLRGVLSVAHQMGPDEFLDRCSAAREYLQESIEELLEAMQLLDRLDGLVLGILAGGATLETKISDEIEPAGNV